VTGLTYRFIAPLKAWAIHRAVALGLCGVIAVHVLTLLVDFYMPFPLKEVLVPFASHYTNNTPLFGRLLGMWGVALGIFAMYGLALIVASSLGWIDSHKKAWRWLHYLSYFVMAATLLHALIVGHEFREGSWRLLLLAGTVVVVLGVISRVMRAGSLRRSQKSSTDDTIKG
jgi:branched-subunit amino acid transport protein